MEHDWKDRPVTDLPISGALKNDLAEDGIETIRQLLEDESYADDQEVEYAMSQFYEQNPDLAERDEEEWVEETDLKSAASDRDIVIRHNAELRLAGLKVYKAEVALTQAKKRVSDLKREYDEAVKQLKTLARQKPDPQRTLFDTTPSESQFSDAWRDVPVEDAIPLSGKVPKILEQAGITTMGQFEDLRGTDGLQSLSGIGQETADMLEDFAVDWSVRWHQANGADIDAQPVEAT